MTEPGGVRAPAELDLGPLGYGAANVGNLYRAMTDDEAWAVLDAAWESGIRYFDTAPHYGLGLSERRLGAFLATKPRHDYVLSTKVGRLLRPSPETADRLDDAHQFAVPASLRRVWDFTAEGIRRSLEESLERLGLDTVDVVYLHDPEEDDLDLALASGVPGVAALREEGLVSAVGLGSKSTEALLAGVRAGGLDLVMVAGRFTLVEQPALDDLIPLCREADVGVVAAAVFNTGLLSKAHPGAGSRYEYGDVPADVLARTQRIEKICAEYDVALPQAALHFPLQEAAVRCVVVGGARPAHVRENAELIGREVPPALWERLAADGLVRR
jgi:D-threo-aldose 1-dehydrogenase